MRVMAGSPGAIPFALYRALAFAARPGLRLLLWRRLGRGKEEGARLAERYGETARPRPRGTLVWLHAASIGEALSTLPLIERLAARAPAIHVLVTTGTVTSARLLERRLPACAFHQYVPIDAGPWVRRFLAHWRPDLALWIESELWPNLVLATAARGVPIVLVNARMSERSFRGWRRWRGFARLLVSAFGAVLAQSQEDAARYRALGAARVSVTGNLKYAAAPLAAEAAELEALRVTLAGRPVWLAASVHPGEAATLLAAHRLLLQRHPTALLVLVPRHAERCAEIAAAIGAAGFAAVRRSEARAPEPSKPVYLADTIGELGLFYRLAPIAFIGGSLVAHGGQNPIEAALLGCAILHGPHMENFADVVRELGAGGATRSVDSGEALAASLVALLANESARRRMSEAAAAAAARHAAVLDRYLAAIEPHLPAAARAHARADAPA
jgi:3-deoxy-D-manno-octulosonic-acid transferase